MAKRKQKTNKGKRYDKPISLYPIPFEQAVRALIQVPRLKKKEKRKRRKQTIRSDGE